MALACGAPAAGDKPIVFRGARILPASKPAIESGTLVIQDGKIIAVGPLATVALPGDAETIDAAGLTIIPGLVDTHSHLGVANRPGRLELGDTNESTGPIQTGGRALDAIYPFDPGMRMATAGGVTTANIMPGSGNVIGGQTLYVKLRGNTIDQMRIEAKGVLGGLKMANGENPKRSYGAKGQAPGTRMKLAALQRGEFLKARDYLAKWERYRQKAAAPNPPADLAVPDINIDLEPLVEVLQRKRTVHFHSHRADDILTAVRIAEEFNFEIVIQHGTESYKVADELAKRKIPVSMTVVDSPGGKAETVALIEECGAQLSAKGVKVLINTDDPITDSRFLLRTAAIAVRGGLSPDLALKAITLHGAEVMHLDHRLGSLDVGKDADFAVLSGDPFSVYTRVRQTWIDGKKVFDVADPNQKHYQTGGFGLPPERRPGSVVPVFDRPQGAPLDPALSRLVKPNASSKAIAVYARRVHTAGPARTITDGVVAVRNGKIVFVGKQTEFMRPDDMAVLTANDVTPGLIDAYSAVPLTGQYNIAADQDQDEKSGPVQPDLRVLDAFNPREALLGFLLEQGITVIHACPGRVNVIAGQSGVFRTYGQTVGEMTVRFPQAMVFNLGSSAKGAYAGQKPGTRMAVAGLIRSHLTQAREYQRKKGRAKEDAKPDTSPSHEALNLVLDRSSAALFCAQRADDLLTALRIADEFKLRPMLALATEGYLVADQLAAAKAPILVHPSMQTVGDLETLNTHLGNAALLSRAGLPVAVTSAIESYVPKTRVARHEAAVAMIHGLGFAGALRTVTLEPATILGIADRFGSLEAGKVADVVLYDGDPFEYATHVEHVIVDGRVVYSRAERQQIPFDRRVQLAGPAADVPCCLIW